MHEYLVLINFLNCLSGDARGVAQVQKLTAESGFQLRWLQLGLPMLAEAFLGANKYHRRSPLEQVLGRFLLFDAFRLWLAVSYLYNKGREQ
jgi:hypothetical protein